MTTKCLGYSLILSPSCPSSCRSRLSLPGLPRLISSHHFEPDGPPQTFQSAGAGGIAIVLSGVASQSAGTLTIYYGVPFSILHSNHSPLPLLYPSLFLFTESPTCRSAPLPSFYPLLVSPKLGCPLPFPSPPSFEPRLFSSHTVTFRVQLQRLQMDFKLLSAVLCVLFAFVQANFALGRISTRPSAGKRSLRSFPPKYAVIRTAYEDRGSNGYGK